ncbi:MAG TPA: ribonuclease PH, partial [Desulfopila sp.]|nr:ribonuclease PH [Desulfopila sp.]
NRADDEMRPLSVERNIQPNAEASVLIKLGNTHVICAVSVEEKVPSFLAGSSSGWITAEYGMLPGATSTRYRRESSTGRSGRTLEIQRLIGRSLRMMVDLTELGERTLRVDCDVINADGGTRTAAITGAAIAVRNAIGAMASESRIGALPAMVPVAAVSAGIVDGRAMLDLDYLEDSRADCDANFVMTADGRWVEIQSTAEGSPFSLDSFVELTELARRGGRMLFDLW